MGGVCVCARACYLPCLQVLRFHDQPHVDKILRLCTEAEKRGTLASTEADRGGAGRRGGPAGRRNQCPGIIQIDPDTAVMPLSRAAIFRAAGAACFAVDEVREERSGGGDGGLRTSTVSCTHAWFKGLAAPRSYRSSAPLVGLSSCRWVCSLLIVLCLSAG